ncbi:TetR/AcrR family transcriptional regulator [Negadavirga shengliensis]|uniref:TetR/AcrR family transcriptional regulator n=1 Tax=Negadavirga shengliensis TaxID=1389218 RepID=A0ABV9SZK3_9BACT
MGVYERQQKEKKILEAAVKLFGGKGFHYTKVEDVAKQAKISKGLVYFYFKSKEDLYMAVAKKGFEELKDLFNKAYNKNKDKKGIEIIADLVEAFLSFTKDKKVYHEAILYFLGMLEPYNDESERKNMNGLVLESQYFKKLLDSHHDVAKIGIKIISQGIKDGSMRPDLQAEATFYTLWSMLIGNCWLQGTVHYEPKDIKISAESWKNGFLKLFFEILKGSQQNVRYQPVQGKLF